MEKELSTIINGITYPVKVTKKRQRNIYFRFRDNSFFVTAPTFTTDRTILESLKRVGPKLIERTTKATTFYSFEERYVYIFGEKEELDPNIDTVEKLEKYLKKILLEYVTQKVEEYSPKMGVDTKYKVRVRKMKTRHGSNSRRTKSLTFQLDLVHFDKEIIDSVIYHELTHEHFFDHSAYFYKFLLSYCPNYFKLKNKLKKGIVK